MGYSGLGLGGHLLSCWLLVFRMDHDSLLTILSLGPFVGEEDLE